MDSYVLSEIVNGIKHEKELAEKIKLFYEEVNEKVNQKGLELKEFKDYIISLLIKNEFDSNTLDNLVKASNNWLSLWRNFSSYKFTTEELMGMISINITKSNLDSIVSSDVLNSLFRNIYVALNNERTTVDVEEIILINIYSLIIKEYAIDNSNIIINNETSPLLDSCIKFMNQLLNDFFEKNILIYSSDIKRRLKNIKTERFIEGVTDLLKTNELGGNG